jgi:hypothetical protein
MPSTPMPAPARIDEGTLRRKPELAPAGAAGAEEPQPAVVSPLLQRFEDGPPLDIYGIGI